MGQKNMLQTLVQCSYLHPTLMDFIQIVHCVPKKHVTTFSTITIGVRLQ